ncbi:MAG: ABC transporter substrate-binding protein [Sulfurovum sp.]
MITRIILIFILLVGSLQAKELEKVSLQLHWKYQFQFAGFIIAKEKGFYKDVGLDVELKEPKSGMNIEDEVLSGKSNYGIYNSNILISALKNRPIKLLGSFFKGSALVLITAPNIKIVNDLIGKTIMTAKRDNIDIGLKYILDSNNINIKDIQTIPHTYSLDEFINGKCDAMTAFISDQPYKLNKLGIKYNIINPTNYGLYNLHLELFTSNNEAINFPKRTKKFLDASIKGWKYALKHKDEIINIIMAKYNKKIDRDTLEYEAEITERLIMARMYEIGSFNKNFLNKQIAVYKKINNSKKNMNLNNLIFNKKRQQNINLTKEEKEYIKNKKSIKVCIHTNQIPFVTQTKDGYSGLSIDFLNIISKETGLNVEYLQNSSVAKYIGNTQNGTCDMASIIVTKPNKFKSLTPTISYILDNIVIATGINEPYRFRLNNFKNKKIMIQKDFKNFKNYIRDIGPNLQLVDVDVIDLNRVVSGEFYGAIGVSYLMGYKISRDYLYEIKIMTKVGEDEISGSFGISNKEPLLLSIFNKSIKKIPISTKERIYDKYRKLKVEKKIDYDIIFKTIIIFSFIILIMFTVFFKQRKLIKQIEIEKDKYQKIEAKIQTINKNLEKRVHSEVEKNEKQQLMMLQQSRLAQMGEMIGAIAHQWRQPLNTLSTGIQNLKYDYKEGKLEDEIYVKSFINKSKETVKYMSQTIDDFRNFFRIDKEKKDFKVLKSIEVAIDMHSLQLKSLGIDIELNGDEFEHFGFESEYQQVILNIISNAKDALIENSIEEPKIQINLKNNQVTIEDNAGGIPDNIIYRVFEPYFTTKEQGKGTGIGLYMSKMIIEGNMGGSLSVDNGENGAIFTISFEERLK